MEDLPDQTMLQSAQEVSSEAAGVGEKERHLTLFRVGSLLVGDQRDLCLVKNVFSGGAVIRAYSKLRKGQSVGLELNENQPIAGKIAGVKGADTRIEFNERIDVLALLKIGSDGPPPRMPRVEVQAFGLVRQGAITHRVGIANISQGGIGIHSDANLRVGDEATVTLAGLPPQPASVRWGRSGAYGITFNSVLGLPDLVEWLHAHSGAAASN